MSSVLELLGKYDNLDEPVPTLNTRPAIFALIIPFLIVSWICGLARLYTRFVSLRCPGWDDVFVMLVMITTLALSAGTCSALDYGLGKHFIKLSFGEMAQFVKAFYLPNATYAMSTCFIKLALLFQYLRIFEPGTKLRLFTKFVIVFTACWGFAYSFIAWVPCWPVTAYWDWSTEAIARWGFGSHDISVFVATYVSHVASNVVLDLIVFAIPVPLYFNPELTGKSRMGLCGLVALGLVVNSFSIWRLAAIIDTKAGTSPTLDPSWYGCGPIVLAALEVNLALICASLPVFWPAIEQKFGRIFITREVDISRTTGRLSSLVDMDTEMSSSPTHKIPDQVYLVAQNNDDLLSRLLSFPPRGQSSTMIMSSDLEGQKRGFNLSTNKSEPQWRDDKKSSSEHILLDS